MAKITTIPCGTYHASRTISFAVHADGIVNAKYLLEELRMSCSMTGGVYMIVAVSPRPHYGQEDYIVTYVPASLDSVTNAEAHIQSELTKLEAVVREHFRVARILRLATPEKEV